MDTPLVQERLKEVGSAVVSAERRSPDHLQKFVVNEIEKWGRVIRESNIKPD
jgi:mitochondrial fission protein ELM1